VAKTLDICGFPSFLPNGRLFGTAFVMQPYSDGKEITINVEEKMRATEIMKKTGIGFVAMAMLLGIGTALSSTAQAQPAGIGQYRGDGDFDRDDNYGFYGRGAVIRIAQRNGYNDGFAIGRRDRFNGRRPDFDDTFRFQNAMAGYRPGFGDPGLYRQAYRAGFHRGYYNGFRSAGFYRW
jgi:hypothetical protein